LKDVVKVAFLPTLVELIGHLNLSNIVRKEPPQGVSGLAVLQGIQICSDEMDVLVFCICHVFTLPPKAVAIHNKGPA
jgi:hypothetical protein